MRAILLVLFACLGLAACGGSEEQPVVVNPPPGNTVVVPRSSGQAPVVVAMGTDAVAEKIKELAKENDVPQVRNAVLARTLYDDCELDTEIPFAHYQAVAEVMVRNRYGRITFVSSRAALGNRGQTNYSATKAAVIGLSKTLAIELGPFGITSNAVGPGFIETEMTRAIVERTGQSWDDLTGAMRERAAVKRTGLPEDIAAALAYFSLPEAGFTTGQAIFVTGSPAA